MDSVETRKPERDPAAATCVARGFVGLCVSTATMMSFAAATVEHSDQILETSVATSSLVDFMIMSNGSSTDLEVSFNPSFYR